MPAYVMQLMKNHMVQVSSEDDLLNNTVYNTK